MTWTYSGNPGSTPMDEVRFLIRDTNTNNQLMQNEEINYMLSKFPNPLDAAWRLAMQIGADYGSKASKTVGRTSISYTDQRDSYNDLATTLRRMAVAESGYMPEFIDDGLDYSPTFKGKYSNPLRPRNNEFI